MIIARIDPQSPHVSQINPMHGFGRIGLARMMQVKVAFTF
jgi:hypothetical protein